MISVIVTDWNDGQSFENKTQSCNNPEFSFKQWQVIGPANKIRSCYCGQIVSINTALRNVVSLESMLTSFVDGINTAYNKKQNE